MMRRDFLIGATATPLAARSAGIPARSSLDAFIDGYAREHDFSGTILVRQRGRTRCARSFGLADRAFGVPNAMETHYWIASITKAFTAVLILQLVEQGRVALDGTIGACLPDYAGEARDRVTVHQLLNHTSGLENIDRIPNIEDAGESIAASLEAARTRGALPIYQTPYTSDDLLRVFCSGKLVREPGTAFDYNNADYIVLGKIVERCHGMDYDHAVRMRIMRPLGLVDTGLLRQRDVAPRLARCYSAPPPPSARPLEHDTPVYPENWYAAGGLYSTAGDVLAFSDALFGGRLIGRDMLGRMTTPGLDDYGYGVWSRTMRIDGVACRVVTRPGRIMGARAQLLHMPDAGLTIVMLANTGAADLDAFSAAVARRVAGQHSSA